jgi:hypothetical protein
VALPSITLRAVLRMPCSQSQNLARMRSVGKRSRALLPIHQSFVCAGVQTHVHIFHLHFYL